MSSVLLLLGQVGANRQIPYRLVHEEAAGCRLAIAWRHRCGLLLLFEKWLRACSRVRAMLESDGQLNCILVKIVARLLSM